MAKPTNEQGMNDYEKLQTILAELPPSERKVINVYHAVQEAEGYVPRAALRAVARLDGRSESEQQGLLSFFDSFRTRPPAAHTVAVCYGTACYARGAPLLFDRIAAELKLDADGYSPDGSVCVERVFCVGACAQAPLVVKDGAIEGRLRAHQVPSLLSDLHPEGATASDPTVKGNPQP